MAYSQFTKYTIIIIYYSVQIYDYYYSVQIFFLDKQGVPQDMIKLVNYSFKCLLTFTVLDIKHFYFIKKICCSYIYILIWNKFYYNITVT